MTIRLLVLTATAFLISSCGAGNQNANGTSPKAEERATSVSEEEAIRQQVARWLQLVESKDAAAIAQIYTEDGAVMPPNAKIGKGRTAIQQTWASMMNTPGFRLTFTPEQIIVSDSGDMALDRGTYRLAVAPSGKPQSDAGKYVVVWRKVGGEWKAVADIFNSDLPVAGG